jgi:dihydroxyacetone kinase
MSKFFMNDRKTLINDVIEGVILTSPYKNLAKLDIDPAIRVVVRRCAAKCLLPRAWTPC